MYLFQQPSEHQRDYNIGMKAPCSLQVDFSLFNELGRYCPGHWGSAVCLWRATFCPNISLSCLVIPMRLLHQQFNQKKKKPSPTTGSLARLQEMTSPVSITSVTRSPHSNNPHTFQKVSAALGFYPAPQMLPNSSHLFLYPISPRCTPIAANPRPPTKPIVVRNWKYPRSSSTEDCITKMCYIYTVEDYSAGKWMELKKKKIIPSETTQTQKDKHGICSLISEY